MPTPARRHARMLVGCLALLLAFACRGPSAETPGAPGARSAPGAPGLHHPGRRLRPGGERRPAIRGPAGPGPRRGLLRLRAGRRPAAAVPGALRRFPHPRGGPGPGREPARPGGDRDVLHRRPGGAAPGPPRPRRRGGAAVQPGGDRQQLPGRALPVGRRRRLRVRLQRADHGGLPAQRAAAAPLLPGAVRPGRPGAAGRGAARATCCSSATNRSGTVSHVGIYVGGDTFIHAPRHGRRISREKLAGYYRERLVGVRTYL